MAIVGYARVSTGQQDHTSQVERLKEAGAEKVFAEKRSGLDGKRPELARCLEYVREGDTLVVTKVDRLARSTSDFWRTIEGLQEKGVAFRSLDDREIDTTSRNGRLMLSILSAIAEFETAIRKERQMEGIAQAKAKAKTEGRPYAGRPKLVTDEVRDRVLTLRKTGLSIRRIAVEVGLSKATIQKIVPVARPSGSTRQVA